MLQTLYVGNFYGTRIYIHWSFWILALLVFLGNLPSGFSVAMSVLGFVFAVFTCVLLHELGHALAARAFGRATRDITLLPIGGVARIEGSDQDAWADGWIAFAGPAVNLAIACVLGMLHWVFGEPGAAAPTELAQMSPLQQLLLANLFLAISNLIPIFPLDGGRILRSLLCYRFDRPTAHGIASRVGQWGSGLLILLGIVWFNFGMFLMGLILLMVNTFQRLQSRIVILQRDAQSQSPDGTAWGGPWSGGQWPGGPWSGGQWPGSAEGRRPYGDTIDAVDVREVPPESPSRPRLPH